MEKKRKCSINCWTKMKRNEHADENVICDPKKTLCAFSKWILHPEARISIKTHENSWKKEMEKEFRSSKPKKSVETAEIQMLFFCIAFFHRQKKVTKNEQSFN